MSKNKSKLTVEDIAKDIKLVAKRLNETPQTLTRSKYLNNSELVTDHQLRKFPTFATIKNTYLPLEDKDLKAIQETKELASYVRKLEKEVGQFKQLEEIINKSIDKHFSKLKIKPTSKPKFKKQKNITSEVTVCLNDTHYGAIIEGDEVGGINHFDWQEACRRTAFLAKQTAEYKVNQRKRVKKLNIILNGDIIQGIIHGLKDRTQDLLALQITGATHILIHFIQYVSQFYPEVEVHCLSGNHDDALHRRDGGRIIVHKYDNYSQPIFYALSAAFRKDKKIKFNIPKTLYTGINLPGGKLLVTHGDTIFSKQISASSGNIQVKNMSDAVNRFNAGEISKGNEPYKAVLLGHVHTHAAFTTFDGIQVQIVPSLSGTDGFAHSLGINHNLCKQIIFESTKDHVIGDARLVDLTQADTMKELDKIIPVYNRGLKYGE